MACVPSEKEKLERQKAVVIRFLYWFIIIVGVLLVAKFLLPAIFPFVLAYLIAWALNRPITFLSERIHLPRGLVSALLILLCAVAAFGIMTVIGVSVVSWVRSGVMLIPEIVREDIFPVVEQFFNSLEELTANIDPVAAAALETSVDGIFPLLNEGLVKLSGGAITMLGSLITFVPSVFMKTLITLIASIFIAADFVKIRGFLFRLIPEGAKKVLREAGDFFGRTVPKCLGSYVIIWCITCLELWVGFRLIGVERAGMLAVVIAILDILPILGTGTILIPWAIITMIGGEISRGVMFVVLYVVITAIRNMIEPRLVGKQIQLHPVLTFAGMLTGLRFFGVIGMFGVPLGLAFIRQLHENGVIYIHVLDDTDRTAEKKTAETTSKG